MYSIFKEAPCVQTLKWLLPVVALGLAGCAQSDLEQYLGHSDTVTVDAGDAISSNRAIHTVDPWSRDSLNNQIDIDGKRAEIAIKRYEKNKVVQPKGLTARSPKVVIENNSGVTN
ncbi:MAG: hypothetical protein AAF732_12740 [Pseudomonadota bacterium]